MFDKVQQPTKVVERTYLTNVGNTNFIAHCGLNRRFEIVYVRTLDSYVGEQHKCEVTGLSGCSDIFGH